MISLNFDPFPIFETDRLLLRRLNDEDVDGIFALRSNPKVMEFVPRPLAKTRQDALDHINKINQKVIDNEAVNWAITVKGSPDFIGIVGYFPIDRENFRAEIGYMLLPEFHGNGYASEVVSRVLTYGFDEIKLHSVEAIIAPENRASARVLEKNHFEREAHLKENAFYEGRFLDTVIYSILARNHQHNQRCSFGNVDK